MKSNMTINVEFLAGTSFVDAVREAKTKASEWNVAYVCFKFNGVSCSIGRNADLHDAQDKYIQGHKTIIER